jgi:hypothetical protein
MISLFTLEINISLKAENLLVRDLLYMKFVSRPREASLCQAV